MNLWGNRIGQLAVLAVALLFFTCEDESSFLGYKNPNQKFDVRYVEIPIVSSVVLIDSLETSNAHYTETTDFPRVMAGRYSDPLLGEVKAEAYAQFRPTTTATLSSTAVFDSVSMQLRFDHYVYGDEGESKQTFAIHELTQGMVFENKNNYYNNSSLPYNAAPLGSNSFSVSTAVFKEQYADATPDTSLIRFRIDPAFGARLFDIAKNNTDSALHKPVQFYEKFKGIAIVPVNNSKIVGFLPGSALFKITLHYHDAEKDSLSIDFPFSSAGNYFVGNFSKITSNRSASADLSGLTTKYTEHDPSSGRRYVQAGTGLITKLDISKFYDFARADSNQNIIINSAQLVVENVESFGSLDPPYSLTVMMLRDNNRFQYFTAEQDTTEFLSFRGFLSTYDTYGFAAVDDNSSSFTTLTYSKDKNKYSSILSLFFQQLYRRRDEDKLFKYFALYPHATRVAESSSIRYEAGKSVNRVAFHKDNIKLKVFYTRPTINSNQ